MNWSACGRFFILNCLASLFCSHQAILVYHSPPKDHKADCNNELPCPPRMYCDEEYENTCQFCSYNSSDNQFVQDDCLPYGDLGGAVYNLDESTDVPVCSNHSLVGPSVIANCSYGKLIEGTHALLVGTQCLLSCADGFMPGKESRKFIDGNILINCSKCNARKSDTEAPCHWDVDISNAFCLPIPLQLAASPDTTDTEWKLPVILTVSIVGIAALSIAYIFIRRRKLQSRQDCEHSQELAGQTCSCEDTSEGSEGSESGKLVCDADRHTSLESGYVSINNTEATGQTGQTVILANNISNRPVIGSSATTRMSTKPAEGMPATTDTSINEADTTPELQHSSLANNHNSKTCQQSNVIQGERSSQQRNLLTTAEVHVAGPPNSSASHGHQSVAAVGHSVTETMSVSTENFTSRLSSQSLSEDGCKSGTDISDRPYCNHTLPDVVYSSRPLLSADLAASQVSESSAANGCAALSSTKKSAAVKFSLGPEVDNSEKGQYSCTSAIKDSGYNSSLSSFAFLSRANTRSQTDSQRQSGSDIPCVSHQLPSSQDYNEEEMDQSKSISATQAGSEALQGCAQSIVSKIGPSSASSDRSQSSSSNNELSSIESNDSQIPGTSAEETVPFETKLSNLPPNIPANHCAIQIIDSHPTAAEVTKLPSKTVAKSFEQCDINIDNESAQLSSFEIGPRMSKQMGIVGEGQTECYGATPTSHPQNQRKSFNSAPVGTRPSCVGTSNPPPSHNAQAQPLTAGLTFSSDTNYQTKLAHAPPPYARSMSYPTSTFCSDTDSAKPLTTNPPTYAEPLTLNPPSSHDIYQLRMFQSATNKGIRCKTIGNLEINHNSKYLGYSSHDIALIKESQSSLNIEAGMIHNIKQNDNETFDSLHLSQSFPNGYCYGRQNSEPQCSHQYNCHHRPYSNFN